MLFETRIQNSRFVSQVFYIPASEKLMVQAHHWVVLGNSNKQDKHGVREKEGREGHEDKH